jgi:hypothetical protein
MCTHQPASSHSRLRRWSLVALVICGTLLLAPTWVLFNASAASGFANAAFQSQWQQGEASTPNYWGPLPLAHDGQNEPYVEAPGGSRLVQYFDKARMELTNPTTGVVTNGLLANELITGREQIGDATFQQFPPAAIPIAGDPNNAGPTYAQLGTTAASLLAATPARVGGFITVIVAADGSVTDGGGFAGISMSPAISAYDGTTQHNVLGVFADFRTKVGLASVGLATSEPFRTTVQIAGTPQSIIAQVFERRVLTYNNNNPDPFKVEFGNIGQHYYTWRYVTNAGSGTGTATTTPTTTPTAPILTNPTVTNITPNKATISFTTDVATCGTAEIRLKGDTNFATNIDSVSCTPGTSVVVTLTSLDPSMQYEVRGAAKVGSGPIGYSGIASFTTLSAQPTADSYDGNWVNEVTPTQGQFSRLVITVTGTSVNVHVYDKGTPADTDVGMQTATFTSDPLTFNLNGHHYVISFTDATRTHLNVVVTIALTGAPEGTYTFHRQFKLFPGAPITVITNPVLVKP